MLNNLTNFFNLIKGRRIKTTLEDSDLIAVGTKQSQALGDYKPTVIQFKDLKAQVGGLQTVAVDGVTITGDGTLGNPLIAVGGSSAITYSNVFFVDTYNGNDATATQGRFDKPYQYLYNALAAASASSPTSTSRALVYVRKGVYTASLTMANYVDIYCEPGTVFTSGQITVSNVSCNWFGKASWNVSSRMLYIAGAVDFNFEFDKIDSQFAIEVANTSSGNVTMSGRYIKSGLSTNITVTLRGAANITMNIDQEISGYQEVINFRYASGNIVINCPRIKVLTGNFSGGNFKAALKFYENYGARVTVNGDLLSDDPTYYGGTSGMIGFWSNPNVDLTLNGNIYGKGYIGAFLPGSSSSICKINGNVTSDTESFAVLGGTKLVVQNSFISYPSTGIYRIGYLSDTVSVWFINCEFNNQATDSHIIELGSNTVDLNVHNCVSQGTGVGYFVNASVAANVRLHNVISNNNLSVNVTNLITLGPGFIYDTAIKTYYLS